MTACLKIASFLIFKIRVSRHVASKHLLPPSATAAAEIVLPLTSWFPSHFAEIGLNSGLFLEASNSDCIILEWFLWRNRAELKHLSDRTERHKKRLKITHPPAEDNRLQVKQTTEREKRKKRRVTSTNFCDAMDLCQPSKCQLLHSEIQMNS